MKKLILTVDFDVEVPDDMDLASLTCDINLELMRLFDDRGPNSSSKVLGYTTQYVEEVP